MRWEVVEEIVYEVEAATAEEALKIIENDCRRDRSFKCVLDRYVNYQPMKEE